MLLVDTYFAVLLLIYVHIKFAWVLAMVVAVEVWLLNSFVTMGYVDCGAVTAGEVRLQCG